VIKKAVLFSNYEATLIDQKIRPKLVEHGVEILRQIHVDKTNVSVDVSKMDLVLFMPGLMSKGQKDKVKNIARYSRKRLIEVQLHGNDWGKVLSHLAPAPASISEEPSPHSHLRAVPTPPPSEEKLVTEKVDPEPTEEERLLEEYGAENTRLEAEVKALRAKAAHLEEQLGKVDLTSVHDGYTNRLKDYNAEIARLLKEVEKAKEEHGTAVSCLRKCREQLAIDAKAIEMAKKEVENVHELQDVLKNVSEELASQQELGRNQAAELARLRSQRPLSPPSASLKKTQDFVAVRDAIKSLWRAGVLNEKEVVEKLMSWDPKE